MPFGQAIQYTASMTWNYRIVKYSDAGGYGLHEVYYNSAGKPCGMTEESCRFFADAEEGPSGIVDSLQRALNGAIRGVLDESEFPPSNMGPDDDDGASE